MYICRKFQAEERPDENSRKTGGGKHRRGRCSIL